MTTLALSGTAGSTTNGTATAVLRSTRAELLRMRRWPAL